MAAVLKQKVLLYVLAGLVVLGVGVWGLFSGEGGAEAGERLVVDLSSQSPEGPSGEGSSGPGGIGGATTTETPSIYVQVAGAVRNPGVYRMDADARVFQALREAGGVLPEGDEHALPLAASLSDGVKVLVPREGEGDQTAVQEGDTGAGGLIAPQLGGESGPQQVSLNRATMPELQTLPGVGPKTAEKIIAYREDNGGFASVEELQDIPGIGPVTMSRLRELINP